MKFVPDTMHGLGDRPHWEPGELDREFEPIVTRFLRRRYGKVEYPLRTDDLTVLIEEYVDELDLYADLTGLGVGVEGVTSFRPGGKPKVLISGALGGNEVRENRLRTTLSHEFGHVHLHAFGIDLAITEGRIDRKTGAKIVCKRETMITAPQRDWREWQAGYACGAILMPATAMKRLVTDWNQRTCPSGTRPLDGLISEVVGRFAVSREAATVRLRVLNLASHATV